MIIQGVFEFLLSYWKKIRGGAYILCLRQTARTPRGCRPTALVKNYLLVFLNDGDFTTALCLLHVCSKNDAA